MKLEMTKPIIRVGNSAGVLLPKEWLNGTAKIELVEKPVNIKLDVMEILAPYLEKVLGIYLVGSYARGEQTRESDIDVLAITSDLNKEIERGKYNITLISQKKLEESLENNALPLIPMLKESKVLLNPLIIKEYQKTELTSKNLKFHIETTKSAIKISEETIELIKITGGKISDSIIYSLILRLREVYIVEELRKKEIPSTDNLLQLIIKITGSKKAYEAYLRVKEGNEPLKEGSIQESEEIYKYILKEIMEQEKWIKTKKNR